jgi:hypothetical protein
MPRLFIAIAVLGSLSVAAALSTAACSSSSPHGTASDGGTADTGFDAGADVCEPPNESDADLTAPTVSFTTDVVPIFQQSCAIAGGTCHGVPEVVQQQRPYLGDFDGGTDAAVVVKGLVGVASDEDPQMDLVTASSPETSYLMHKMDFDQCNYAADCAKGSTQYTNCGLGMPYSDSELPATDRDTVRRWIAQGASNN